MIKKMIYFSNQQVTSITKDAGIREISFTEMVRRILDRYYEKDYRKGDNNVRKHRTSDTENEPTESDSGSVPGKHL